MKKKKYEKPSVEVVVFNQKPVLLAGSQTEGLGTQKYGWNNETEE